MEEKSIAIGWYIFWGISIVCLGLAIFLICFGIGRKDPWNDMKAFFGRGKKAE